MDDAEPLRNRHIIDPGKKIKAGWSQSMVARVLRNEAVIGRYHPAVMQTVADENGEPIRGKRIAVKVGDDPVEKYYPPVIQPGQFQRVRGLVEGCGGLSKKRTSPATRATEDAPVSTPERKCIGGPE
jgi:hypothetical protein